MDMNSSKRHWNYRVVIEQEPDLVNKGEYVDSVSFRDVYYEDGVPDSWGAGPQPAVGETPSDLINDIRLMAEALTKPPLLIRDGEIQGEANFGAGVQKEIDEFLNGTTTRKAKDNREMGDEVRKRAYGMHEYEMEEEKRRLVHEIEKAKMTNDSERQKHLMEAYDRFRTEMARVEKERKMLEQIKGSKSDFEKYPF